MAVVALIATSIGVSSAAPRPEPDPIIGTWVNPRGSVAVRTGDCNGHLCGWVSWANAEALADARDGGIANLVGTELLHDYASTGSGLWHGTVFVPDMGRSFYSTIQPQGQTALKISGCILGGLICKSQVWRRVQ